MLTRKMHTLHKAYSQRLHKIATLSAEEETVLVKKWREDGHPEHLTRLVEGHLKLVTKIAMGYRGYGLPVGDLVSEGHVGIMNALKNFDPEKGFRFSTYASWWVKASIHEYIFRMWSLLKIGTKKTHRQLFFKLRKTQNTINQEHHNKTEEEQLEMVAERLNADKTDVQFMHERLHYRDASLNTPFGEANQEWIDWLDDTRASAETHLLEKEAESEQTNQLQKAMHSLNEREFLIIKARYLVEPHPTLEELSLTLKISRERVRQVEKSALQKLKKAFQKQDDTYH